MQLNAKLKISPNVLIDCLYSRSAGVYLCYIFPDHILTIFL